MAMSRIDCAELAAIPFAVFDIEYLCLERVSLNAIVQFGYEISGENVPSPSGIMTG